MCEFSIACWNVVRKADACVCSVLQRMNYYPFGGSFGDGVGSSVQDYLYSGKELTRFNALNWLDYGARWYDPATLRWNGVDPMAEKYHSGSPYVYCLDNPIRYVDLDGKDIYIYFTGKDGKTYTYRFNGNKDENIPNNSYVRDYISAYNFNIKCFPIVFPKRKISNLNFF